VTNSKESSVDLVLDCFFDFGFSLEQFYDLMRDRCDLIDLMTEVQDNFSAVSESIAELLHAPSWEFWKTRRLSRHARIKMASVHGSLVDLESNLLGYERNRSESIEMVRKDRDASLLSVFFRNLTKPDVAIPSSLGAALAFFESELQLYGNIRSILLASLLGAIVGALLSGVVARFIH
jgi:hypothetical protein